jgi:hypothetical protein
MSVPPTYIQQCSKYVPSHVLSKQERDRIHTGRLGKVDAAATIQFV